MLEKENPRTSPSLFQTDHRELEAFWSIVWIALSIICRQFSQLTSSLRYEGSERLPPFLAILLPRGEEGLSRNNSFTLPYGRLNPNDPQREHVEIHLLGAWDEFILHASYRVAFSGYEVLLWHDSSSQMSRILIIPGTRTGQS